MPVNQGFGGPNLPLAPTTIAAGQTLVIPDGYQMLVSLHVDSDGWLELDGFLVEVD